MKTKPKWIIIIAAIFSVFAIYKIAHWTKLKMTVETDLFSQGQVEMNTGHYDSAIEIFETFLSRDPNHVPALQFKLQCEMKQEKWSIAIKTAEKIYSLQINSANKAQLYELYKKAGKMDLASKLMNEVSAVPSPSPI